MRIAIIADVHGNLHALEAVLADIEEQSVDRVIVNGDFANRGPDTLGVYRRLAAYLAEDATLGNHDDLMVIWNGPRDPARYDWLDDPFWRGGAHAASQLAGTGALARIQALPMTIRVEVAGAPSLLVSHGSPRHYREGYGRSITPELISEIVEEFPADVLIGSHTHRPLLRSWARYTVMNTGSVGSPFNGDVRAQYLIVSLRQGRWEPEFRRVAYDLAAALAAYDDNGLIAETAASGTLERDGLDMWVFREELKHARSFLVPFMMWAEVEGLDRSMASWEIYRQRHPGRFAPPEPATATASVSE